MGGLGAESYDHKIAWPSVYHSIVSGFKPRRKDRCGKLIWGLGDVWGKSKNILIV